MPVRDAEAIEGGYAATGPISASLQGSGITAYLLVELGAHLCEEGGEEAGVL